MSRVTTAVVHFFADNSDFVSERKIFSGTNGTNLGIEIGDYATAHGYPTYAFARVTRKPE